MKFLIVEQKTMKENIRTTLPSSGQAVAQ